MVCKQNKERLVWIDQLRSAAILLVILGHVSLPSKISGLIYSFHMPLFFIITGLTMNRVKLLQVHIKEYVVHQIKSLLIPYYWLSFLMFPIWYLTSHYWGKSKVTIPQAFLGIFVGNGALYAATSNALWFVLALFLAKILYVLLVKLTKNRELLMFFSVLLCAVIGYADQGKDRIWHCNVAFTGVVFIYLGNCIMQWYRQGGEAVLQKMKKSRYVLFTGMLAVVGMITAYFNRRISMNANTYGKSVVLFYVTAIAFACVGMLIAMKFSLLNMKFTSLITYIGKNTLLYVGVHVPLLRVVKRLFPGLLTQYKNNVMIAFVLYFGMALLCVWMNHTFPFVCGKKAEDSGKSGIVGKSLLVMWCTCVPYLYVIWKWGFDLSNWSTLLLSVIGLGAGSGLFVWCMQRFLPVIFMQNKENASK